MSKTYKWRSRQVIRHSTDAVTVIFESKAEISYQPGQYVNVVCQIEGQSISRSYSLSSSPQDDYAAITVKRVPGGRVSNFIVDYAESMHEWSVEGPFGNFVLDKTDSARTPLVFLAGGSGISPLFSMLRFSAGNRFTPLVMYSNRIPEKSIFLNELLAMNAAGVAQVFLSFSDPAYTSSVETQITGRFSEPQIKNILRQYLEGKPVAQFFLCGPTALMNLYIQVLSAMGVADANIHKEEFDLGAKTFTNPYLANSPSEVMVCHFEQVLDLDQSQTYECLSLVEVPAGKSLYEAIKDHGIRLPGSCLKGSCGSCWAIREKGNVQMARNFALTEEDLAQGRILLCQSYPVDEYVSILVP